MGLNDSLRVRAEVVPLVAFVGAGIAFGIYMGFHKLRRNPDIV